MPVKIMSAQDAATKYTGLRTSPITETVEYREFLAVLQNGLKRSEACVIEMPLNPAKKHARASFKRAALKTIRRLRLPYSVRAMRSGDLDVIVIANESEQPVSTPIRKAR